MIDTTPDYKKIHQRTTLRQANRRRSSGFLRLGTGTVIVSAVLVCFLRWYMGV